MLEGSGWRRRTTAEEHQEDKAPEKEPDTAAQDDVSAARDAEVKDLTDTLKRVQAEFENYKKRVERDWSDRTKSACEKMMSDLLPVLDTFDKAMENAKDNGDAASLRKGLESIHRQLLQTLQKEGLREIETKGKLDPFRHESLMRVEQPNAEEGAILEVFQKGYMLGPKVIRTAKVKVASRPETHADDHKEEEQATEEDKE